LRKKKGNKGEKMKSSWNIGKIFGIDLKVHLTFIFLIVWVAFSAILNLGTFQTVLLEILFILALFGFVVLHEAGHALAAKRFGIPTRDITLLPIGGIARLESMPEDPKEELWVALAGPTVNVLIAGILFVGLLISGTFTSPLNLSILMDNFWVRLLSVNISLVLFNLIPAFPMDGGRVLRSLLASRMDKTKATQIAANIGKVFAIGLGIAGFFLNPWLVLTAIFIWSGANTEANSEELKANLKGLVVRDALVSQFYQVEANQPLGSVFQLALQTGQNVIPVVSNGNFLGFIQSSTLMKAIEKFGERAPAYAAINLEPKSLDPDLPLEQTLQKFTANRVLPVVENRQLIGFITPVSVQQRMLLNRQVKKNTPSNHEETNTVS
jgi:Zn-dependent protease